MTKCFLIYPPMTTHGSDSSNPGACPPLGLAYIAAVLEENRYEVMIIDALGEGIQNVKRAGEAVRFGLGEDIIKRRIQEFEPDIVGISAMFTAYAQDAHDMAKLVKGVNSDILVVFGGSHASVSYDVILQDDNVDMVVKGEGELTFLEIIKALENNRDLKSITGTIVRTANTLRINPDRPYIEDLDCLPYPARHLLPMHIYLSKTNDHYCMRSPHTVMITSRGCPQRCIYCSIHAVWGHRWRPRSAAKVVDEIEFLVDRYQIREIHFNDDSISVSKKRMHEICDEIINRRVNIRWTTPNGIALWTLDEPLIKKMKESGCYRLTFGIESGNIATQKFIMKNLDLEKAKSLIKYANNLGLWTISTHILGFPYEDAKAIDDTIKYAVSSDTDFALFYLLMPFRGTLLYEIFRKEMLLPTDEVQYQKNFLVSSELFCDTKYFSRKQLGEIQNMAYSSFWLSRFCRYLNPLRILKKIHSFEDARYVLKLAGSALAIQINRIRYGRVGAKTLHRPVVRR